MKFNELLQLLEYTDAVFRAHNNFEPNPLLQWDYKISKEMVFNALEMSSLTIHKEPSSKILYLVKKIKKSKRYNNAIEMFEQFGELTAITLAEKLDITKKSSNNIINELKKLNAIDVVNTDEEEKSYVITPRVRHELTKA